MEFRKIANDMNEYAIAVRRYLHTNPEISKMEYKTQAFIMGELDKLGVPYIVTDNTGIIATYGEGSKCFGIRADIDALPIEENQAVSYCSVNRGVSHACGHDGHTAILLATIKAIVDSNYKPDCKLKFIFQPDEEVSGGAKRICEEGVVDDVDSFFGLHLQPYLLPGHIEYRHGALNATCTAVNITVKGKAGHAAYPQNAIDSIVVMSNLIVGMQSIISRNLSPLDNAVLTFGTIKGGEVWNQVAEEVEIRGTLRTFDHNVLNMIKKRLTEICKGFEESYSVTIDLDIIDGYIALINGSDSYILEEMLKEKYNPEIVHYKELPSLGGEDFSYFLEKGNGVFIHLGCNGKENYKSLHSKNYDFDESCLVDGVNYYLNCVDWFSKNK